METLVLVVHVLIASMMTLLILMQQGKGADAGASFGAGGSQTVFGSAGSASFLTKLTAGLALVFFATSMILAVYAKQQVSGATILPAVTEKAPAKPANSDIPASAPAAKTEASVSAAPAPAQPAPAPADVPASSAPAAP